MSMTAQSLYCPHLPLAIYRQVVSHLRQVPGVSVNLLPNQPGEAFDYLQSQVGGVLIEYTDQATAISRQKVEKILAYYSQLYGNWENFAYLDSHEINFAKATEKHEKNL